MQSHKTSTTQIEKKKAETWFLIKLPPYCRGYFEQMSEPCTA